MNPCQLSQLLTLQVVFALLDRHQQLVYHLGSLLQLIVRVGSDEHVQFVLFARIGLTVLSTLARLHRSLATNRNLGTGLSFHLLLCVATWANDETDKVVLGMLLHRNINLLGEFLGFGTVVCRWLERWVHDHGTFNECILLADQFLFQANFTSVGTLARIVICGWR